MKYLKWFRSTFENSYLKGNALASFSISLDEALHQAIQFATERKHELATLEHLLLALTYESSTVPVLQACDVDVGLLRRQLTDYLDAELSNLVTEVDEQAKPTASFHRVVQRAVTHVQAANREEVTGANVLVALFAERESDAVQFLNMQDMSRFDAVNYISNGVSKKSESILAAKRAIPSQRPSPLQVRAVGGRITATNLSVVRNSNDSKIREAFSWLYEEAKEVSSSISRNSPHVRSCVDKYVHALGPNIEELNVIRLGVVGNALEQFDTVVSEECSNDVLAKFRGLLANHALFINRFEEWRDYLADATNHDAYYEADSESAYKIAESVEEAIDENQELFDDSVENALREVKNAADEPNATAAQKHAFWTGLSNVLAKVSELALEQCKDLGGETWKKAKTALATTVGFGAVGFVIAQATNMLALAEKYPFLFSWVSKVLRFFA